MKCTDIFEAMIADLQSDVQDYLRGNTGQFLYQSNTDADGSVRDVNAENRMRLCCALAFGAEPARGEILRTLLDAECAAREAGCLPECGCAMTLLTAALKETEPADSPLLDRAKQAGCGAADCGIPKLDEMTPAMCIAAASGAGMTSYLCTMFDAAKQEVPAAEYAELLQKYAGQLGGKAQQIMPQ